MTVRELATAPDPRWDDFVRSRPESTFFHVSAWKRAVERAFGHACHYLFVEEGGEIRGVLPLIHVQSVLFGNALISTGFGVYGGPLAVDDEAAAQLDAAARDLMGRVGADFLEYRCCNRLHDDRPVKDSLYVTFRKPIESDDDANLKNIPRKQRAMVRKGMKAGLVSEIDRTPERQFALYAESMRNLGTPVFPKNWFDVLMEELGEDCEILTVLHEGRPVAAVMSFFFRNEVLPFYGGGSPAARDVAANDFMYWEVMRRAAARGCRVFDFGRSKVDSGSYHFKKHWGFEPEPLYYEYVLAKGERMPEINPRNPKYRALIAAWQRLPLSVANRLGPMVARKLG